MMGMSYMTKAAVSNGRCPHCGQAMPQMRMGVRMFPQTARVFDIIKAAGREGISGEALFERAYAGVKKPSYSCIKGHVDHARASLAGTDYEIRCDRNGRHKGVYRLVKVVQVSAFG
jgi:hypothetical protein